MKASMWCMRVCVCVHLCMWVPQVCVPQVCMRACAWVPQVRMHARGGVPQVCMHARGGVPQVCMHACACVPQVCMRARGCHKCACMRVGGCQKCASVCIIGCVACGCVRMCSESKVFLPRDAKGGLKRLKSAQAHVQVHVTMCAVGRWCFWCTCECVFAIGAPCGRAFVFFK